jgi:hypothetical protein
LNPLVARWDVNTASIRNGNLDVSDTVGDANNPYVFGTISVNSGKFYWEITVTAIGTSAASFVIGVDSGKTQSTTFTDWVSYAGDGNRYAGSTSPSAYGATYTTGDVIGVALDKDAGTVTFYKNNTSQGAISLPTNVPMVAWLSPGANSGSATANFGQRPFAYTAPSGFKALCTQNLPTPTIGATTATQAGKFFNPVLYTGDRTSRTISVGFQPDWVWVKSRNDADDHYLMNAVVGTGKYLNSNSTAAETTNAASLTAYTSDGFSVGNTGTTNETSRTYVAWNWKANGSGSTNTAGSITSTVSANTTSGFSVVNALMNTGTNQSVGHGLGVKPAMVILKNRAISDDWYVWHQSFTNQTDSFLRLNLTNAVSDVPNIWGSGMTSTVIGVRPSSFVNASQNVIMYAFAEVAGYSKFGSYTGNGSTDGPFVYTGMRPAWILFKLSSSAGGNWFLFDSKRSTYNVVNNLLYPNASNAEYTAGSGYVDLTSNGFKIRTTSGDMNTNGSTYIYACFAENPFKYSLAR